MKRKEYFHAHFLRPALPRYPNQTKTLQKKKLQAHISDEHRCKNLHQNMSKRNLAIHFNNTLKVSSDIYSRDTKMVQYLQINQCDTSQ